MSNAQSQPSPEAMDRIAAAALDQVREGMKLGLGTGRAAEAFIRRLAARASEGLNVVGVTTSNRSEALAGELGIPLATLETVERLDIAFDGADEVTDALDLTKGLGGALLRERVVAHAADRFVVLVTPEKRVAKLGTRTHIPIEVVRFACAPVRRELAKLGAKVVVRQATDGDFLTDNGNLILDARFTPMDTPGELDAAVRGIPGVVDTGLFLGMADQVLVGEPDRVVELSR